MRSESYTVKIYVAALVYCAKMEKYSLADEIGRYLEVFAIMHIMLGENRFFNT
jgi:hypothetical protein